MLAHSLGTTHGLSDCLSGAPPAQLPMIATRDPNICDAGRMSTPAWVQGDCMSSLPAPGCGCYRTLYNSGCLSTSDAALLFHLEHWLTRLLCWPADRVFGILKEHNPELTGEKRRTIMKPPQVPAG